MDGRGGVQSCLTRETTSCGHTAEVWAEQFSRGVGRAVFQNTLQASQLSSLALPLPVGALGLCQPLG